MATPAGYDPAIFSVTDWRINHFPMGPNKMVRLVRGSHQAPVFGLYHRGIGARGGTWTRKDLRPPPSQDGMFAYFITRAYATYTESPTAN